MSAAKVDITPSDFYSAAQQFVAAQGRLYDIRDDLLRGVAGMAGSLGASDGAHQFGSGFDASMLAILANGFAPVIDLVGGIGKGIDVSARNHWRLDHESSTAQGPPDPPWPPVQPEVRTPGADAGAAFPISVGDSPWWMPGFVERYIPTADTDALGAGATACQRAADAIRGLFADLHGKIQGLVGNNSSDDVSELEQFWQRACGTRSLVAELPKALDDIAKAMTDFSWWNDDTRDKIQDSVNNAIEDVGVLGGIGAAVFGAASFLTDGGFDALMIGVIEALGPEAEAVIATPIAEAAAAAAGGLVVAGGAVAIAKGIEPAITAAMANTPNPSLEGADATQLGNELGEQIKPPKAKYPQKQLQSHFKHADDFGVTGNWSKNAAQDYENALREFADDPSNTVNLNGRFRGQPAVLVYNESNSLCEVLRPDGTFWTGFKLDATQFKNVMERGSLGGG